MDQKNIIFFENDDESYTMVDLYLYHRFFGYRHSYYHYYIYADEILFKKVIINILLDIMMCMI